MTTYITDFLSVQSVHLAVLFAIVAAAAALLRRQTAHLRYLLWLLIVAKCFVPPLHTFSLPVLPERIENGQLTINTVRQIEKP
jgi:hypothetical protein